jgi:hypothetical protein
MQRVVHGISAVAGRKQLKTYFYLLHFSSLFHFSLGSVRHICPFFAHYTNLTFSLFHSSCTCLLCLRFSPILLFLHVLYQLINIKFVFFDPILFYFFPSSLFLLVPGIYQLFLSHKNVITVTCYEIGLQVENTTTKN